MRIRVGARVRGVAGRAIGALGESLLSGRRTADAIVLLEPASTEFAVAIVNVANMDELREVSLA